MTPSDNTAKVIDPDALIDDIRQALDIHYDYPSDSRDPDRSCPITDKAYRALDLLHLEIKYINEAFEDVRHADQQTPSN